MNQPPYPYPYPPPPPRNDRTLIIVLVVVFGVVPIVVTVMWLAFSWLMVERVVDQSAQQEKRIQREQEQAEKARQEEQKRLSEELEKAKRDAASARPSTQLRPFGAGPAPCKCDPKDPLCGC